MCEFCHQHGDGKKWYLKAENYSEDLLNDLERRQILEEFFPNHGRNGSGACHGTCGDDCDSRVQAPGDHRPVCIPKFLETHLVYSVC